MSGFKIIPVLDILNSTIVHAHKGERDKYKPLKTYLFDSSEPTKILKEFVQKYGFNEFYIADLDAIIKKNPNLELLSEMLKISNIKIIIDPGIVSIEDIYLYSNYSIEKLILGLETIESIDIILDCLKVIGSSKTIVSIDMYKEKIRTKIKEFRTLDTLNVVKIIAKLGVNSIILLDLFKVGQKLGGIPPLYHHIKKYFAGEILVGGGVKDLNDIKKYKSENFDGILIGTALYDGTIKVKEIKSLLLNSVNKNNSSR
ncbi:MAG: HisA/HisF-related TIM barrel protein [Candidatus Hodarchaeota archaeon]